MTQKAFPIRLDSNIKKAVLAGKGYKELVTYAQFLAQAREMVNHRIICLERELENFIASGGDIDLSKDGLAVRVTVRLEDGSQLSYMINYDPDGSIRSYTADAAKGRRQLQNEMHQILFVVNLLPQMKQSLKTIDEMLEDINNNTTINSLCDVSEQVNKDMRTLLATIGGLPINEVFDNADPFGLFGEEEE